MSLYLFANNFPFDGAEPFLVNEFSFTQEAFSSIECFAVYGSDKKRQGFETLRSGYVLKNPLRQSELLVKGLFNWSPVTFHAIEFFGKGVCLNPRKWVGFFTSLLVTRAALASKTFRQLIIRIENDETPVLYFYWCENLCWTLPYLKRKLRGKNLRIVTRLHGGDLYEERKKGYMPLREMIFKLADRICPVSENGRIYLAGRYPEYSHKMEVHLLGVFDRGINPAGTSGMFTVLTVARLTAVKRVHLLFEALQKLDVPVLWHHFGGGPLEQDLIQRTTQTRSGLQVSMHGDAENATIMKFYIENHVDLFVNTSVSEGVPVAIMEALSFGVPVLAPAIGGIPELVTEDAGGLLSPGFDTDNLASALNDFARLPATRSNRLRDGAREVFLEKADANVNYRIFYLMLKELKNT